VEIKGRQLVLSNLEKIMYPSGFTKGEILQYYLRVSSVMVPHLKDRPLTLKRYPEGSSGGFFYEKRCPDYRPGWLPVVDVKAPESSDSIAYCTVNDVATLIWIANLASIEFHVLLSGGFGAERPTCMVFDLDPGEPAGLAECALVAQQIRRLLDRLKTACFIKTSGGKGMHLYVPLNTPVSFEQTSLFAQAIATFLERQHPNQVTSKMTKSLRRGKVLVDWSQNSSHKTTVSVYSLRAGEYPSVSAPLKWDEVDRLARDRDAEKVRFDADATLRRIKRFGDLFAPVLSLRQRIPSLQLQMPMVWNGPAREKAA
jgi:bifunctional non-homologous end joining protein LigD